MRTVKHPVLAVSVLASVLTIAYSVYDSRAAASPVHDNAVSLNPAERGGQESRVSGAGIIEPPGEAIALTVPFGGVVHKIYVQPGQRVKRGESLLELDSAEAAAEVHLRRKAVETAANALEKALADAREKEALLSAYMKLKDSPALVPEELTRRKGAAEVAVAQVAASRAALGETKAAVDLAVVKLQRHTLRSPEDATILQVRTRPGEWSQPGSMNAAAFLIARNSALNVRVDIDESDISRFEPGAAARIAPRSGGSPSIQVSFVRAEPLLVPKKNLTNANDERVDTRVLQLIYELPLSEPRFVIGQQVDVFLPTLQSPTVKRQSTLGNQK